jgi:hypothetical protein
LAILRYYEPFRAIQDHSAGFKRLWPGERACGGTWQRRGVITRLAGIVPNTVLHVVLAAGFAYYAW